MRALPLFITSIALLFFAFAVQSVAVAQSVDLTKTFKKSFNNTVTEVQNTENVTEKRELLNDSFSNMITAIERIESQAKLSEKESAQLKSFKKGIVEKKSELNGEDGFSEVLDKDLDDFSDYSQQYMEQADRTITIGITTALIVLVILLLL